MENNRKKNYHDRRSKKTDRAIHMAMIELLETKQLEQISVTMLCNKADISRSTFYSYYSSPEECFQKIAMYYAEQFIEQITEMNIQSNREFFHIYFEYLMKNQTIFRSLHRTNIYHPVFYKIWDGAYNQRVNNIPPEVNKKLFLRYHFFGFFGIVKEWLENNCKEPYEQIIDFLEIDVFKDC